MSRPPPPDSFRHAIISGTSWNLAASAGGQLLSLALSIALMRLLSPATFGLMGMVTVFTGFAAIFGDLGFTSALVQKSDATEGHYVSIFWVNLALGSALTLLFIAVAPLVALVFNAPALLPLTAVLALNFLVVSPAWVPLALLQKRMEFKKLALIDLASLLVSGLTAIVMALAGLNMWSLAGQAIAFNAMRSLLSWRFANWRPRGRYRWALVHEMTSFGSQTTVFTICNYWIRNADNFLIGKLLGREALGLYGRAYNLMLMPLTLISSKISAVIFPAFSAIQTERPRIAAIYLRTIRLIALLSFPMMMGLFFCANDLVLAVFGHPWKKLVPLLQILSWVGMVESIGTLNGSLYLSQGRTKLRLRVLAVVGPIAILAILIGSRWGIVGVAAAYALYSILVGIPSMIIPLQLIGLRLVDVGRHLLGVTACTAIMGGSVWICGRLLPAACPPLWRLLSLAGTGFLCYTLLVLLLKIEGAKDVIAILQEQLHAGKPSPRRIHDEVNP